MGSMALPASMATSYFTSLPEVVRDEVFTLMGAFHADAHPHRVNLGAGIYCSDEGKSWPLEVVGRVEKTLYELHDAGRHDYLAIEGDARFLSVAKDLAFSTSSSTSKPASGSPPPPPPPSVTPIDSRVVSVQTISGTGANHIGARFLAENLRPRRVWLSDPTWANHHTIWQAVGVPQHQYPYYNHATRAIDFTALMEVLEREAEPRDVVLLHACAHNPTGLDPSQEQWRTIAELCQRKKLFPFFDNAYQGFASGDPVRDAWAISHFYHLQPPIEMCVAQSFSKNFGLYGQRAGAFHLVINNPSESARDQVQANLAMLIRSEYSVAPRYGSTIIRTVLESDRLVQEWLVDLQVISGRIKKMRKVLYDELCRLGTPGSWSHIIEQIGTFSYTGLTPSEVAVLRTQFHIYMLSSGRISVAGLTSKNVKYVAAAIHAVRTKS